MTTNDTCPHCGAEYLLYHKAEKLTQFKCGTTVNANNKKMWSGNACHERQIAAQAAEIERLKEDNKHLQVNLHKLELLVEHRRQSRG